MKIARTARFKKSWEALNETQKELSRKALGNLANNLRHPSLRVKKMQGTNYIWEARASRSLRITFQIQDDLIILRNIGQHDELLRQP